MTKGPRRLVLDQYLDSSAPGAVTNAGRDWKRKADDLQELGDALKQAAAQAELRIGEQTLTGPALRAGMEESSVSMLAKAEQLRTAGEALRQVGQQLADTRDTRDSLVDLGEKPSAYQAPPGTPGVERTPEEIQAQADASQARSNERGAWQTQYDKQEARSLALTKEMDAGFLAAIPPMKDIHGQQDPTEPPPNVPSGPGGTYLPGTQAPPPTGSGNGDGDKGELVRVDEGKPTDDGKDDGKDKDDDDKDDRDDDKPKPPTTVITNPPPPVEPPTVHRPPVHVETPTSTVTGTSQNGVTYQPTGSQVSAPAGSVGGSSAGVSAAALGAAGGAGGMAAGAVRPGAATGAAASGSAPVRAIGSTGRAGSAGALSRSAGTAGSSPAGMGASAGSSAAGRGAGSAGSPASRGAGSAAGRGASTGSSAGRGGAGGRGAGSASGSRSGGRGANGARSAGSGTGGGRKGEREQPTDRDSLVYDQDWLGDDDVAPGVLD